MVTYHPAPRLRRIASAVASIARRAGRGAPLRSTRRRIASRIEVAARQVQYIAWYDWDAIRDIIAGRPVVSADLQDRARGRS